MPHSATSGPPRGSNRPEPLRACSLLPTRPAHSLSRPGSETLSRSGCVIRPMGWDQLILAPHSQVTEAEGGVIVCASISAPACPSLSHQILYLPIASIREGSIKNHALSNSRRHGLAHQIQKHALAALVLNQRGTADDNPWAWATNRSPCSRIWPRRPACRSCDRRVDRPVAVVNADSDPMRGVQFSLGNL